MKKKLSILVFGFGLVTSYIFAESFNRELLTHSNETVKINDDYGCASNCVFVAKTLDYAVAFAMEEDVNDDPAYLEIYKLAFSQCYISCKQN